MWRPPLLVFGGRCPEGSIVATMRTWSLASGGFDAAFGSGDSQLRVALRSGSSGNHHPFFLSQKQPAIPASSDCVSPTVREIA